MSSSASSDYVTMVANLAKPGDAIVTSLTGEKAHLWHMVSALMGETAELLEAVQLEDIPTIREELGDLRFYTVGIIGRCGIADEQTLLAIRPAPECDYGSTLSTSALSVAANLVVQAGNVFDAVKRFVIYCKAFDFEKADAAIANFLAVFAAMCRVYNVTVRDIEEANMAKLLTGSKPRYAAGIYSDAAAQSREDKNT